MVRPKENTNVRMFPTSEMVRTDCVPVGCQVSNHSPGTARLENPCLVDFRAFTPHELLPVTVAANFREARLSGPTEGISSSLAGTRPWSEEYGRFLNAALECSPVSAVDHSFYVRMAAPAMLACSLR